MRTKQDFSLEEPTSQAIADVIIYIKQYFLMIESVDSFFKGEIGLGSNQKRLFFSDEMPDTLFTKKFMKEFMQSYKKVKIKLKPENLAYIKNNIVDHFFKPIQHSEEWVKFCKERGLSEQSIQQIQGQFIYKLWCVFANSAKLRKRQEIEKGIFFKKITELLTEYPDFSSVRAAMLTFCQSKVNGKEGQTFYNKLLKAEMPEGHILKFTSPEDKKWVPFKADLSNEVEKLPSLSFDSQAEAHEPDERQNPTLKNDGTLLRGSNSFISNGLKSSQKKSSVIVLGYNNMVFSPSLFQRHPSQPLPPFDRTTVLKLRKIGSHNSISELFPVQIEEKNQEPADNTPSLPVANS
jgi:hypothetical protein